MNRRTRNRTAFTLVGIAAAAAGIDRLLLQGGPQHADASDRLRQVDEAAAPDEGGTRPDSTAPLADVFDMLAPRAALGERVGETATPRTILERMPELFGAEALASAARPLDGRDASTRHDGLPVLTGVSEVGGGAAVLDGRIVRIGETVGRYRLVDVDGRTAMVSDGEQRHRLSIGGGRDR